MAGCQHHTMDTAMRGHLPFRRDCISHPGYDELVYDPAHPVQTLGGNDCCSPHLVPWGPQDQRPRNLYTGAPTAKRGWRGSGYITVVAARPICDCR